MRYDVPITICTGFEETAWFNTNTIISFNTMTTWPLILYLRPVVARHTQAYIGAMGVVTKPLWRRAEPFLRKIIINISMSI